MASTNKTTNYELSQFQSSDIPAWLTDYNGDMQKIDAGIHAAKTQAAGAASGVSALQTVVSGKQDRLTFDSEPISGSSNPVTSGGIYEALQSVSVKTDAVPTAGSTKAVQSGGVYMALQGKQNTLTFDNTPTQGSTNPVTSGGVYSAIVAAGGGASAVSITVGSNQTGLEAVCYKVGNLYMLTVSGFVTKTTNSNPVTITIPERVLGAPTSSEPLDGQKLMRFSLNSFTTAGFEWRYRSTSGNTEIYLPFGNNGDTSYVAQTLFLM